MIKFLSILMIITVLISFTACSDSGDNNIQTVTQTCQQSEEKSTQRVTEPGVTDVEIRPESNEQYPCGACGGTGHTQIVVSYDPVTNLPVFQNIACGGCGGAGYLYH